MYAPTWRVRDKFELMLDLEKMKEKFSDEYVLILKIASLFSKRLERVPADGFVCMILRIMNLLKIYISLQTS